VQSFLHEGHAKENSFQNQEKPEEVQEKASFWGKQIENLLKSIPQLYDPCKDIALNFQWIFCTANAISPAVEESKTEPKIPFGCVHSEMCAGGGENDEKYPAYPIETFRFLRILKQINIKLAEEDLIGIAKTIKAYRFSKEFGPYILYDKVLLGIRNGALTKEELDMVKRNYISDLNPPEREEEAEKKVTSISGFFFNTEETKEEQANLAANTQTQIKEFLTTAKPIAIWLAIVKDTLAPYQLGFTLRKFYEKEECPIVIPLGNHEELPEEKLIKTGISFEDSEVIKKIDLTFDGKSPKLLQCQFTTNSGKAYTLPMLIDDYGKQVPFAPEDVKVSNIAIKESQYPIGFFTKLSDKDTKSLCGFGVHCVDDTYFNQYQEYLRKEEESDDKLPTQNEKLFQGKFQLVINHCSDCKFHKKTTWHEEAVKLDFYWF